MSDLNEFLQVLAEAKKHRQEEVAEVQKGLGDFLAAVADEFVKLINNSYNLTT